MTEQITRWLLLLFYFAGDWRYQEMSEQDEALAGKSWYSTEVRCYNIHTLCPPGSYAAAIIICCWCLDLFVFFPPPNLRGRSVDRHQTLPRVRKWPRYYKFGLILSNLKAFWYRGLSAIVVDVSHKFGAPTPTNLGQKVKMSAISRLDGEYLWNATIKVSSNRTRRCKLRLLSYLIWWTLVYKRRKHGTTGVSTHPTGGHHAGLFHAFK